MPCHHHGTGKQTHDTLVQLHEKGELNATARLPPGWDLQGSCHYQDGSPSGPEIQQWTSSEPPPLGGVRGATLLHGHRHLLQV